MNYLHLELKVCEGCGMLWIRRIELDSNYCAGCTSRLVNFPVPVGRHGGGRPRTEGPRAPRRRTRTSTRRNRGCSAASPKAGAR
jgi:hypothetical protein